MIGSTRVKSKRRILILAVRTFISLEPHNDENGLETCRCSPKTSQHFRSPVRTGQHCGPQVCSLTEKKSSNFRSNQGPRVHHRSHRSPPTRRTRLRNNNRHSIPSRLWVSRYLHPWVLIPGPHEKTLELQLRQIISSVMHRTLNPRSLVQVVIQVLSVDNTSKSVYLNLIQTDNRRAPS
jgi:hypothetical protein